MNNSKPLFLLIALACFSLIGAALYLQVVERMQPCPWCIIQRYIFLAVGLICLLFAFLPPGMRRTGAGFGAAMALAGAGAAGWHAWIQAHPEVSCGIDPLETSLNTIPPAQWLPLMFKADGLCSTLQAPILGLSIPQWSLVWFLIFALALCMIAVRRDR